MQHVSIEESHHQGDYLRTVTTLYPLQYYICIFCIRDPICITLPVPVAACLRRRSAPARLLRLWVRIPPGAWKCFCCECCVLSGRGLCDGLITRPEESYRLWCVVVCDLETSWMRGPWPTEGLSHQKQTNKQYALNCVSRKPGFFII